MNRKALFCIGSLSVALALSIPATGQTPPSAKAVAGKNAAAWTPPRTPDGHPDLQGVWSNATDIPLERPKELGAKEFYTEQERAEAGKKGYLAEPNASPEAHYDFAQFGMALRQSKFAPNLRTSLIVGPEGRIPSMTPEGVKRNAARAEKLRGHELDGPENRSLTERCIIYAGLEGPPMLPPMYNNNMEIVQAPGLVSIFNEMYHDVRMIPTDGRPHIPKDIRLWRGDSGPARR